MGVANREFPLSPYHTVLFDFDAHGIGEVIYTHCSWRDLSGPRFYLSDSPSPLLALVVLNRIEYFQLYCSTLIYVVYINTRG